MLAVTLLATLALLVGLDTRSAFAQELSLDDVTIQSFKIIDTTHGDAEIEYSLSSEASPKTDPAAFSNAICEGQKVSSLKLEAKVAYDGSDAIQDGDTLTIPASVGRGLNFAPRPLLDGDNNQLGTFEYIDGKFVLKFSGDYLKNHSIKKFEMTLQTGEMLQYREDLGRSMTLGDRALAKGVLGKDTLYAAHEKYYVITKTIGTTDQSIASIVDSTTNHSVTWDIKIHNDKAIVDNQGFYMPYMLEHNGAYNPNSFTGVYEESTFTDCTIEPEIIKSWSEFTGIDDQGKVVSGWYAQSFSTSALLTKVDQGTKSKSEVKAALQNGQYCMYDNHDGSYTFMLKWWDMNDPAGPKYDDLTGVADAGGMGNLLKNKYSEIFGGMSSTTIEKINQTYAGKALQNISVRVRVVHPVVNTPTDKTGTVEMTSDQGSFTSSATATLTPSSAAIDAPADPLTVKMLKTDKESGAALSTGFSFKLQSSNDGGTSWTDVAVDASMLDVGSLNLDGTLTPDANGAIQVKGLTGGMMYRFVEVSHANGYPDVAVDEAHPNDANHTTSANSEAVTVTSQGSGQVITMYNQKAKVDVSGVKTWDDDNDRDGARPASITVNLLRDGTPIDSKTVTPDASGTWAYSFSGLAQYDSVDGHEFSYRITENAVADYATVINGYDITNSHTPGKTSVTATKAWDDGADADGIRPTSVQLQLYANGVALGAPVAVDAASGWTHTWTNLNEKDAGADIAYTVEETDVPTGYTSVTAGDATNGFTITNTHVLETTDISGTKTWDDAGNQDGMRPQSITVNLLADGQKVAEKQVTEADGWAYSFTGMTKNKAGQAIDYTVTEDAVEGYTATVAGFDITNTHVPGTVDVTVSKTWDDGNDKDGIRPASVMAQLYADGVAQGGAVELSSANGWTSTWTGLAEYQGGHKVSYTVEEASVPDGYTSSVKEQASGNFVITNAHTPKADPSPVPPSPDSKPRSPRHQGRVLPATGEGPELPGILALAGVSLIGLAGAYAKRMRD
ncbi:Cna B-type domain-containing protein [Olsenella uli]|uniref:Cna B-type domain-containing protein n=1 Tax=Olsenella uli TaxID=133926 RepID=UPI0028D66DDD|nr:Cna B-type domain-containing protein [Olsenella uli]